MERIIFNCYLRLLYGKGSKLRKSKPKIPKIALILLLLMLISLGVAVAMILFNSDYAIIPIAIEGLLCLFIYLYIDHYEIMHSNIELVNYKKRCIALKEILDETTIPMDNEFVDKLRNKYIDKLESNNNRVGKNRKVFRKWVIALLVPIIAAVVESLFDGEKQQEVSEYLLNLAVVITTLLLIAFLVALFIVELVNIFIKSRNGEYQQIIDDLQSIIDYNLCSEKDTENCKETIKT